MNNQRRIKLREVNIYINSILNMIESVRDDEESAFDNMPENLQGSNRAFEMEENIDYLDDAIDYLNDAVNSIEEII